MQALKIHAETAKDVTNARERSSIELLALSEMLKLIFNVTYHFPAVVSHFKSSIPPILDILLHESPRSTIEPPINLLLNALMNLELSQTSMDPIFSQNNPTTGVEHLIKILDSIISNPAETAIEATLIPVISLLRQVYVHAPRNVQTFMQQRLLPNKEERTRPLGKGDSLAARLLRLSSSGVQANGKESVSNLLFELSDKDSSKFVNNIGFGYASGFLHNHGLPVPQTSEQTSKATWQSGRIPGVNFVTGQNLSDEPAIDEPGMTEDEKIREAERLFVLFEKYILIHALLARCKLIIDRLKATGVVNVKNPVEEALQSGRFEELSD